MKAPSAEWQGWAELAARGSVGGGSTSSRLDKPSCVTPPSLSSC
jgi:hypothetical protein